MGIPATTGQLRTRIEDMQIGDYISCNYKASSGVLGSFNDLGSATGSEIPTSGTNTPNGLFYLIKVDKGILVADRVVQTSISWDALNSSKAIQGLGTGFGDVALLHFDNDFSDDMGNIWTPTGACEINFDLPPKFGSGCLHTPSGTYLTSNIDSLAFGNDDFTIDFWMYYKGSYSGVVTTRISGSTGFAIQPDVVWLGNSSAATRVSSSGFYVTNAWAHYALVRKDNMVYYFVNGVLKGSVSFTDNIDELTISINRRYANSTSYVGGDSYYDEVRVSRFARWTSNFTPPTVAGVASGEAYIVRSLTGGVAFADGNGGNSTTDQGMGGWPTNNEWDKYISNFPEDKIQSGKTLDDVFHHETSNVVTWCQDTPINGMTHPLGGTPNPSSNIGRIHRGMARPTNTTNTTDLAWAQSNWNTVWNGVLQGFRPVFEYKEA